MKFKKNNNGITIIGSTLRTTITISELDGLYDVAGILSPLNLVELRQLLAKKLREEQEEEKEQEEKVKKLVNLMGRLGVEEERND